MTFKEFIVDLFKDERGNISIKPLISFLGAVSLFSCFIVQCFTSHQLDINKYIIDSITVIIAVGMGADSIDKFSYKKKDTENEIKNDE
jgi:hypothetical protein